MHSIRLNFFLALLCLGVTAGQAADTAYWIWGKRAPVTQAEREELQRQSVKVLYRQSLIADGERMPNAAVAGMAEFSADRQGFTVVPVVRVESRKVPSVDYFAKLRAAFPPLQGDSLQVDFDCPDRLLGEYAALLRELRATWPQLSITALTHWPKLKDFPELARSATEVCPMFYDLQRDPTGVSEEEPPPPILDPAQVQPLLEDWRKCPVPWRAGLPTYTRVTVFDSTGLSRGQIFGWEWPQILFNSGLRSAAPGKLGVQLLRVSKPVRIAGRAIEEGEMVAVRQTDPAALAQCRAAAMQAGAAGVVLYRLPSPQDDSTLSLKFLGNADAAPEVKARISGDTLVLENDGAADLLPRLAGEHGELDRGYAIEIDAPAFYFREAEPGDFYKVTAHAEVDGKMRRAPVNAATRLTFWVSHLDAGASLKSGLFQLAPRADASRLRWRIGEGKWNPLISQ